MNIRSRQVAIILVNYNSWNDTRECIESLIKNNSSKFIILVDNGSRPNVEVDSWMKDLEDFHLLRTGENLGFGKANNLGLQWVRDNIKCEFVFLLNNDTIVERNLLECLVNLFPSDERVIAVAPKILTYEQEPRIWYGGGSFWFSRMTVRIDNFGESNLEVQNRVVDFASGCAVLLRRSYLDNNPLFDEQFFMYDEDLELSMRIKQEGKQIYFLNEAVVYHKCQGSQKSNKMKILNQLHPHNPNLQFYLGLTIPNRFFLIRKYFCGLERHLILSKNILYWLGKSAQCFFMLEIRSACQILKLLWNNLVNLKTSR